MTKLFVCAVVAGAVVSNAGATEFWQFDGTNDVSFSKAGFADTSDPANWDVISASVAITRGDLQGLYNPLVDSFYTGAGPNGTLWLFGNTVQDVLDGTVDITDFNDWEPATGGPGGGPPSTVGQDAVLYLVAEDRYIDIKFTGWGIGPGSGGSFSYDRAVPAPGVLGVMGIAGMGLVRRKR